MPVKKRHKIEKKLYGQKDKKSIPSSSYKKNQSKKKISAAPIKTTFKKAELYSHIAQVAELKVKDIHMIFDELAQVMRRHLRKGGAGEFTLPGLAKFVVKHKVATKKRKGINPFTGEPMIFKAKPARQVVKIRALKRLKEMVE